MSYLIDGKYVSKRQVNTTAMAKQFCKQYGVERMTARMLNLLSPSQRVALRRLAQLERWQNWERANFGKVITRQWRKGMPDTKDLAT